MPRCFAPLAASPALALLATSLLAQAPTVAKTPAAMKAAWTPVAHVTCSGGQLVAADFDATGARLLTAGEEGDLCLWDTARGEVLRRYLSLGRHGVVVRIHPREPWAIVIAGWKSARCAHCLDLGSGKSHLLWRREVVDVAFEPDGARAAVLFADAADYPRRQLQIYRDAALLGGAPVADLERTIERHGRLLWEPGGRAVMVSAWRNTLRVPLDCGDLSVREGELLAYAPDGAPQWKTDNGTHDARHGWSVCVSERTVRRSGPRPAEWQVPGADWTLGWRGATIGPDGTIAVGDLHGRVHLLGDRSVFTRVPHLAVPLQLLFAQDGATLAVVGRQDATFVDCGDGSAVTLDGGCAAQTSGAADFAVLRGNDLRRFDARAHALAEPLCSWTAPGPASTSQSYWYGGVRAVPYVWVDGQPGSFDHPPRFARLWLGGVESTQDPWSDALALLTGPNARATVVDRSITELASPRLEVTAIVRLRSSGRMLVAERERPSQCGTGLNPDRYRGALRLFEADGRPAKHRWLKAGVGDLRLSPNGMRAVLLPSGELIAARSLSTLVEARADTNWLDFAFVDAEHGLATDGEHLFEVTIRSMRARPLPLPPGVARIDALAIARLGALLAVADGGNVTLFERTAR